MPPPSFVDRLLGTEPHQRVRLLQTSLALVLTGVGAVAMMVLVALGVAPAGPAMWWAGLTVGSFAGFALAIRLGWNRRFTETRFMVAQMAVALASAACAYVLAGAGRGAVLPAPVAVLMFGLLALSPHTLRRLAIFAIALFGATFAAMAWRRPQLFVPEVEFVHFAMLAAMLLAVPALAAPLAGLRERLRAQQAALRESRARFQDLAIRDELTGLANRRYANEVLALEHQRYMRSGHPFCVAMIDLDHFKAVNDQHGMRAGDAMLRRFATEARESIRISDVLARWEGEQFLLLMTDTRGGLGRRGVDRLRERIAQTPTVLEGGSLHLRFSAGVAEHRAGEAVADTLARADEALHSAKAQGRNRVVLR